MQGAVKLCLGQDQNTDFEAVHNAELLPRVRARRPPKPITFAPEGGPQQQRKSARQLHPGGSVSHCFDAIAACPVSWLSPVLYAAPL